MPKYNEPDSLKVTQAALERHLKDIRYPLSIIRNSEFSESKKVLEEKARYLRNLGRGKRPNASRGGIVVAGKQTRQKLCSSINKYNVVAAY